MSTTSADAVPKIEKSFASEEAFLEAYDAEVSAGGLLVRGATVGSLHAMAPCVVVIRVAAHPPMELPARVASARPGAVAVMFDGAPEPLDELAREIRHSLAPGPTQADAARRPLAERIAELTLGQKIQLAVNGDREARILLLRDQNKSLHPFVLKNVRIQLDEVLFAAKLPTLSPDALKAISENTQWMATPSVCISIVRNPGTPVPVALKHLPRLPLTEIRAIARGGARLPLMQAAKRLIARGSSPPR